MFHWKNELTENISVERIRLIITNFIVYLPKHFKKHLLNFILLNNVLYRCIFLKNIYWMMKKPSHRKVSNLLRVTQVEQGRLIPRDNQHVISDRKQNKEDFSFFSWSPWLPMPNTLVGSSYSIWVSSTSAITLQELNLKEKLVDKGFIFSSWHIHTAASTVCQDYEPSCLEYFPKMLHKTSF